MEKDKETGWNNFELRNYDAAIGRWLTMNPYGQYDSPYVGMGNNPVGTVDPDGGKGTDWYLRKGANSTSKAVWFETSGEVPGFEYLGGANYNFGNYRLNEVMVQSVAQTKMQSAYNIEKAAAQKDFKNASGGLFMGFPDEVIKREAQSRFYKRYYETSEISYFTGMPIQGGALVDANWIIDVGVGVGEGLYKGASKIISQQLTFAEYRAMYW